MAPNTFFKDAKPETNIIMQTYASYTDDTYHMRFLLS